MSEGIPWFLPQLGDRERENLIAVVDSNYINDGEWTRRLEAQISDYIGTRYCVAVTSGTTALTLALMGLGVGQGDEVIIPDLTYVATANAARLAGATVKLVDIEPEHFTIDPDAVLSVISQRTRAVIAVDVNGRGCDYVRLERICADHGLKLVCDSAEAFGSKLNDRFLGSYGDAAIYSFSPNKTVTAGQGGAVVTDDEDLYHRLRELKDQGRREGGTGGDDLHPVIGFNFKLTNLHAAVALAQLDRMPDRLEHFLERDAWYQQSLVGTPGLQFPPMSRSGEVRQWTDILCERRTEVIDALEQEKIGARAFWLPIHRQQPYQASDDDFPNATEISSRGLWLASNFMITRKQVEEVGAVIRQVLNG